MRTVALTFLVLFLGSCATETERATTAVHALHRSFDRGEFDQIWDSAHPQFRSKVSRERFTAYLSPLRAKLGPIKSTQVIDTVYHYSLGKDGVLMKARLEFDQSTLIEETRWEETNGELRLARWDLRNEVGTSR
jgi:hypothetical protein